MVFERSYKQVPFFTFLWDVKKYFNCRVISIFLICGSFASVLSVVSSSLVGECRQKKLNIIAKSFAWEFHLYLWSLLEKFSNFGDRIGNLWLRHLDEIFMTGECCRIQLDWPRIGDFERISFFFSYTRIFNLDCSFKLVSSRVRDYCTFHSEHTAL